MVTPSTLPFQTNRLLAALPDDEYQRILPSLEGLSLANYDTLYEPDKPIDHIYFPLSGMASIVVDMGDKTMVEAGIVGHEGMVGLPVFWGAEKTHTRSFYQVAGEAVRMPVASFKAEILRNGTLAGLLQRYTMAYFSLLSQNSACNSVHSLGQRCARWLLLTHDRVGTDQFVLTQEFLSAMLGVRRAGVNNAMQLLQEADVLQYNRGKIHILDRAGLEQAACTCYGIIAGEYKKILG